MSEPGSDYSQLAIELKAEARSLGFELVGLTTPDQPPHAAFYQGWLAQGYHGEMHYLAEPRNQVRRLNPHQILPECQSILVLGLRYFPPANSPAAPARLAAYAQGADYHDIIPERLQRLAAFLEHRLGRPFPHRFYTDTGPVMERDLAQRAGLGWIGKNTCLINPRHGSYFLLAEMLLGLTLPPDEPFQDDRCGSCTRCLEACPTGCILPDRTLDARACLSYLTIELKSAIPLALRPAVGDWVFGCDICQLVCPWNQRFACSCGDPALAPGLAMATVGSAAHLALSPEAFKALFKKSPLQRARRRGYLRNLAVVLGNQRCQSAVQALNQVLCQEPEPLVRAHAAWALGQIGGSQAAEALRAGQTGEQDPGVQTEIRAALAGFQTPLSSESL